MDFLQLISGKIHETINLDQNSFTFSIYLVIQCESGEINCTFCIYLEIMLLN